jgi:hypothetical protein
VRCARATRRAGFDNLGLQNRLGAFNGEKRGYLGGGNFEGLYGAQGACMRLLHVAGAVLALLDL